WHLEMLKESSFELAFETNAAVAFLNAHNNRCMRPAQNLGKQDSRLCVTIVIRLQTSKDQVELFVFDRSCNSLRGIKRVQPDKLIALEMNRAISAFGESFA